MMTRRSARPGLSAILLLAVSVPIVFIGVAVATGPGDSANRTAVTNLVFGALGSEGDMQLAGDAAVLSSTFTGTALEAENAQLVHVQDLVHQGTDYPGALHLSQQKVAALTGSGDTYAIQVQFHAVRDNMKDGIVVDQSISDVIWQVTVIRTVDGWRISDMHGQFAPGGGP